MNKTERESFNQLTVSELELKAATLRHELCKIRLSSATEHVKDHTQFKKLRRDIARVLTRLRTLNG